jgi:hypothetical protein
LFLLVGCAEVSRSHAAVPLVSKFQSNNPEGVSISYSSLANVL